jgi:hypothetical protein
MEINVTDHALMRFIERVGGVDLTSFRDHIAELVRAAIAIGATQVSIDGFTYVINPTSRAVITILDESERWIEPKARDRGSRDAEPRRVMDRDAIQARRRRKICGK